MSARSGTSIAGWMIAGGIAPLFLGMALLGLGLLADPIGITESLPSWVLVLAGGALVGGGILLGSTGLTLYVLIPAFSRGDRARQDYGSHRVVLACTLLATVIGNLLASLYLLPAWLLSSGPIPTTGGYPSLSPLEIAIAAVSLDLALLAVVYLRVVRPGALAWDTMGLNRDGLPRQLLFGVAWGALLFVAGSLLELLLAQFGVRGTQSDIFRSVTRSSPAEFGLILLAGAVVAPAIEEIYFRGYVFRAYLDHKGVWPAFLFASGLFAAVHLNLPAFLPLFAMALLLALLYYRTGSLVPCIVAHALNNALALTLLYVGLS